MSSCIKQDITAVFETSQVYENQSEQHVYVESYVYKGKQYDLEFIFDQESKEPLNMKVAEVLKKELNGKSPIKLRFSDTPNIVYLFDDVAERDKFKLIDWRARRDEYLATLSKSEIESLNKPLENGIRIGSEWLLFHKGCGGNCTTVWEVFYAQDHISDFDERLNGLNVCSAMWEQVDLSDVVCSSCSGGNWDQTISTITWNIGLIPPKYQNSFTGIYKLGLFKYANFSTGRHCDYGKWVLICWRGNDNRFATSCCLNHKNGDFGVLT